MIAGSQVMRYYHRWLKIRINLLMNVRSEYCDDCNISAKAGIYALSCGLKIFH